MNAYLVGYDIPGIQRYVFEPVRPLDIMGGSALLERFASEAEAIACDHEARTIYSAGGGGLFIAPDEAGASRLTVAFRNALERLTHGGAAVASAAIVFDGNFSQARERLRQRLAADRLARLIDQPTETLLPAGTPPDAVCEACGIETADRDSTIGRGTDQETERIGPRCHARREEGRKRRDKAGGPETIRDLFPRDHEDDGRGPERLPRRAVLAALYLDGDGLGRRLAEIDDADRLRAASRTVTSGVSAVLQDIAGGASTRDGEPVLTPIVGGDDVLLFCDARHAARLLHELWVRLEQRVRLDASPARFSAAIVLSDPYLPLRLLFAEAKHGLERAKERSRRAERAHVELRTLLTRRLHGGRGTSLLGIPVPRERFWGEAPSLRALVESLAKVERAQRSGIANDLSEPSAELRELLLDDRAARQTEHGSTAVQQALAQARDLGRVCATDTHDLLRAALAVVDLWGPSH